jgi:superfamily II DNA or RNA helicase
MRTSILARILTLLILNVLGSFMMETKGTALVVSERKPHCRNLLNQFNNGNGFVKGILTGDTPANKRKEIVANLNAGKIDVLFATTQLIGEGFNSARLTGLFLTTPIKSSQRLAQIVGRILRNGDGKEQPTIHDFLDENGVLQSSYRARFRTYKKLGVEIDA